jgi:glyoxylase-like metal-dependent hydrolase (beta-lactamase superfamily II)
MPRALELLLVSLHEGSARLAPVLAFLLLSSCRAAPGTPVDRMTEDRPYVLVLGTAQDGGLPQIGCGDELCIEAREDPKKRRLVTSLLLCDPRSARRWLFDCTPDVAEQVERARGNPPTRKEAGPRPPLFDGLFLTHAHIGHYGGLLELGREAHAAEGLATCDAALRGLPRPQVRSCLTARPARARPARRSSSPRPPSRRPVPTAMRFGYVG